MFRDLLILIMLISSSASAAPQLFNGGWRFAVSGDSRNCGDVVMPAIAQSVVQHRVEFYWHLGDFRALYAVDEDMKQQYGDKLNLDEYRRIAWGDFISNQILPFGKIPVRLGIGNHELVGRSPADFLTAFGYWLDTPELRAERLSECSADGVLQAYYHWKRRPVDFIYLDNSGDDGFTDTQLNWLECVLEKDKSDKDVAAVVVAMHRALPNGLACGHSMNGDLRLKTDPDYEKHMKLDQASTQSGRRAYGDLVKWNQETRKFVYVLASHSHFYMKDIFETPYWHNPKHGGVALPGWIVGTAGAKRYALPDGLRRENEAQTKVAGYLLGSVAPDGKIEFRFEKLISTNIPTEIRNRYTQKFVDWCIDENADPAPHMPPESCKDQ